MGCGGWIIEYVGWSVIALGAGSVFGAVAAWAVCRRSGGKRS